MSFSELGLSEKVLQAAIAAGYTSPTPIQAQAIPHALARRDVLGIAQTGTGKTAAFTLPMLNLLETGRARARMPRTLILEPTRELAAQVEESFTKLGVNHKLSVALLIGGVSFAEQDAKIIRGADVLIATPGRLLDHFERGKLLLTGIEILVIDEADRMLDMGFVPDIERICKMVPFTRQTLFFSATMPPEIQHLTDTFLSNPVKIEVARPSSTASTITQRLVASGAQSYEKRAVLRRLIKGAEDLQNAIIFCNRKRDVAMLHRSLERHGFDVAALHGDMDQRSRMQALENFRSGVVSLLVASDVAARGLDVPEVSHVFNFDMPLHAEDYVHRIGRTGRAGRTGFAFSIITGQDSKALAAVEELTGQPIAWEGPTIEALTAENPEAELRDLGRDRGHGAARPSRHDKRERRDVPPRRPVHGADMKEQPEFVRRPYSPAHSSVAPTPVRIGGHYSRYRREDSEVPVVGFGDHIPAFLLRAVNLEALASDNDFADHENEPEVIEDIAYEGSEEQVETSSRRERPQRRSRFRRSRSAPIATQEDGASFIAASECESIALAEAEEQRANAVGAEQSATDKESVSLDAENPAAKIESETEKTAKPVRRGRRKPAEPAEEDALETVKAGDIAQQLPAKKTTRIRKKASDQEIAEASAEAEALPAEDSLKKTTTRARKKASEGANEAPKKVTRRTKKVEATPEDENAEATPAKKATVRRSRKKAELTMAKS